MPPFDDRFVACFRSLPWRQDDIAKSRKHRDPIPSNQGMKHLKPQARENTVLKMLLKGFFLLTFLGASASAFAGTQPYNKAQFDGALAHGKPVVIWFHASWCPTCRAQQPAVDRLAKSSEMKDVTVFVADFDKETALEKALRVAQQSTFVVFRGGREVARSTGETDEQAIRATWGKAL
ncbi:thioredoxin family protein [Burkholderia contaminans]|uniref:thioredoxin family protein n=1 Tax=Burkholderia contaminans TaxID=488447 RepID=UPI00310C8B23